MKAKHGVFSEWTASEMCCDSLTPTRMCPQNAVKCSFFRFHTLQNNPYIYSTYTYTYTYTKHTHNAHTFKMPSARSTACDILMNACFCMKTLYTAEISISMLPFV